MNRIHRKFAHGNLVTSRYETPRRGFVLILMIVTLGVGIMILTSVVAITMQQGNSLERELRFVQARQYATTAVSRTLTALRARSSYSGDVWNIPPSTAGQPSPATVTTKVTDVPNHPQDRSLAIDVTFPSSSGTPWTYHIIQTISLKSSP